jgi:hypothetical protein
MKLRRDSSILLNRGQQRFLETALADSKFPIESSHREYGNLLRDSWVTE